MGPYLIALLVAVFLACGLRLRIIIHYLMAKPAPNPWLDGLRNGLMATFFGLLMLFLAVYLLKVLPRQWRRQPLLRQQLRRLALLASGVIAVNLISENLAIYRLNLESYSLLLESLSLYISVTLVFMVWYWYVDQPPRWLVKDQEDRARQTSGLIMPYGIVFPEEVMEREIQYSDAWMPSFIDYFYFTILCSNCFGPPEGHALVGSAMKKLHILHSLSMISVFIVILARAINTLS